MGSLKVKTNWQPGLTSGHWEDIALQKFPTMGTHASQNRYKIRLSGVVLFDCTQCNDNLFVITGGNRGFGLAIANALKADQASQHSTSIILVGRDSTTLEQAATSLNGPQLKCYSIGNAELDSVDTVDNVVLSGIQKLVEKIQATSPITNVYLINNAGTTGDLSKKASDYNSAEIKQYYDVNIVSYVSLVSGFIKLFRQPPSSDESAFPPDLTIVNISSLLAVQAFPNWGLYASGKAARDMFLKVVAAEEKDNYIKTLSYAPGPLDNEMQSQVRATLGDADQKKIYNSMADEVQYLFVISLPFFLVLILKTLVLNMSNCIRENSSKWKSLPISFSSLFSPTTLRMEST
ncbi:unnamed protein product [Umbelopsis ramanniana]